MKIYVNNIAINYSKVGDGPPILLLHGYPQTSQMWHKLILLLKDKYTLVATDLRGYGKSSKPISNSTHSTYSKRIMAQDQHLLMKKLGFNKYICIGHDRGARVAHRLALDYSSALSKLIIIDIVPTLHVYENLDKSIAENFFHWFFLSQRYPIPEKIINANKEYYVRTMLGRLGKTEKFLDNKTIKHYIKSFNIAVIKSSCEDYRAGSTIDLKHHKNDKVKINCPTLILWGKKSLVGKNFEPLKVWKKYCTNVTGNGIAGGHYLPEECPNKVYNNIIRFINN